MPAPVSVKKRRVYFFNTLCDPANCFGMNTKQTRLFSGASPEEVQQDLLPLVDFQDAGQSLTNINRLVEEKLLPHLMRYDHAGFQSMYNSIPEQGAALYPPVHEHAVSVAACPGSSDWKTQGDMVPLPVAQARRSCCACRGRL